MWIRIGIGLAVISGLLLCLAAAWVLFQPAAVGGDLPLRETLASEKSARWAILGVLGALLGNVLLFLNLRIAADATDAAKVAADAAKQAVDHARMTADLELRPYVENSTTLFTRGETDGKITNTGIRLTWRNIGKTPARNIRTFIGWASGPRNQDWSRFDFPERSDWISEGGQIGPESEVYTYSHFNIPVDDLRAVQAGEKSVIFYGSIEYDGLDPAKRHRTEMSSIFLLTQDPSSIASEYSFRFLGRHHGFDEDCLYRASRRSIVNAPKDFAPCPPQKTAAPSAD